MAWRFKASKYKNAAPIVPKPEMCVRDICVGSYQTYGNNIAASAAFMAFNWEHTGSSLAVLPIDDCGRKSKNMPLLHGHTDTITDLGFSPFHDGLLATGSQDCLVKIWFIPEKGLETSLSNPECTFSHKQRRVETVGFHPTADCLLHSTSAGNVSLWDITAQNEIFTNNEHPEVIQSLSWKMDGTVLATSCKDKSVRILDPRCASPICMVAESHKNIKDSRVVWLGEQTRILTTGFDSARLRQIILRDIRNISTPEKTLELDCSTGILMPLYDPDTNMVFLAGKGDTTISYMEVTDKDPFLIEGLRHNGEQTKGACLVPKRALRVMEGEVNRIMQLTSNSVIPIMYQVPRKTYRDFHSDLYPDTNGYKTDLTAVQWMSGINISLSKISLDPAKRDNGEQPMIPRLGPKPFTSVNCSGNISFDNVFSVPQAPGSSESSSLDLIESIENVSLNSPDASEVVTEESLDSLEVDTTGNNEKSTVENDHQHSGNMENTNDMVKSDNNHSLEEDLERAISTAERRKLSDLSQENLNEMFENIQTEAEISIENGEDKTDVELKRLSLNRSSIAERRKLYENRSQSVQEEKPQSPLPLLRKDSLKNRNDCSKDMLDDDASKEDNSKIIDELSTTDVVDMKKLINNSIKDTKKTDQAVVEQQLVSTATKRTSTVFGRVSKFRHLKGTPYHKSTHIENIRNVSRQISGECNGFHANHERVAIPIAGPGGKIVIYELSKPGRLPDGVIPSLVNGSNIMDFQWDPFDAYRLAVACDDGIIKLWQIPQDGLSEPTNVCEHEFAAHNDKIYFIRFHPLASDVLLSASYDMTIKLWDLKTMSEKLCLQGHTDQIFDFAWSPCGVYGATVCKDGKIRVFNPRKSDKCMREGIGPVGTRGARLIWAIEGQYIVCTGFDKVSERQISIYKATDLSAPLNTVSLDVTPGILMPFYDEDSSTLFATGRGDTTIYAFEITDEPSYICPLSHHRCSTVHQGLSFLNKNYCDVSNVEFAKALRLTNSTIEPLSFSVPRIKNELFQDDLFPPTKITWMATISSTEWFNMKDKKPKKISLKPEGMESLSAAQTSVPAVTPTKKTDKPPTYVVNNLNRHGLIADYEKAKKDEIQKSMSARMEFTTKLEQDDMEGVDEVEWEE